ncbi:MAG TPA: hypothetical protein VKX28_00320 [Xanthobacteraceae bacterium]|nr:hypothetical protein [Xanthobacteraceae bacterium]
MSKNFAHAVTAIAAGGLVAAAFAQQPPAPAAAPPPPPPLAYNLSPYLPHDVFDPIPGATGTQGPMDYLSWQTFIALNWPASEVQNGVPDANLVIGGHTKGGYYPNGMRSSPTVWETYKDANDIFLPNARPPSPFSAKTTHVLFDDTESFTDSPLNDQDGKHVYYEVRMNEVEYNYIVAHKLYNANNQKLQKIDFPRGDNATSEVGAVHVKAAWKIMGPKDDQSRYYTAKALIYRPGVPSAFLATVGLVGLHIAHKTASRPEWIWSTFEQVDNAPDLPKPGAAIPPAPNPPGYYNFTNANCDTTKCPPNQRVATNSTTPVQVLRVTPIPGTVTTLNTQFQTALRQSSAANVWQYYELVFTQWPSDPKNVQKFGVPQPAFLANSTIETFFQGPGPKNPTKKDPPHSCMDCHGMFAQQEAQKDFVFQLFKAQPAPKAPPVPGIFNPPRPEALK